jgi:hypothetical protein
MYQRGGGVLRTTMRRSTFPRALFVCIVIQNPQPATTRASNTHTNQTGADLRKIPDQKWRMPGIPLRGAPVIFAFTHAVTMAPKNTDTAAMETFAGLRQFMGRL